jgi:multidrug resistance efflux pump
MRPQLYPTQLVDHFLESYLARHSRRSEAIYLVLLLLVGAALAALPLVRVSISVQSPGLIRPSTEKHELSARAAGFAESIRLRENQRVSQGEVLLTLSSAPLEGRVRLAAAQLADERGALRDLEALTRADSATAPVELLTQRYARERDQLTVSAREDALREEKALRDLERARLLYERELAPRTQLEAAELELGQARAESALLVQRYQAGWQGALVSARARLRELETQAAGLRDERRLYTVRAPVTGTVEEVTPLAPGSWVQAGQRLAVISPAAALVGEVFVAPRDIGLIRPGGLVRMQIDAFNYRDWGLATGRVREVPEDFTVLDGQPVFRVRTTLDQEALTLKNGFRGRLKKGMTMRARFLVTERSLLQLLRDDLDDWLDPVAGG